MSVYAGIVGTSELFHQERSSQQRENLYSILDRDDARILLEQNGVTTEQAQQRIQAMTDTEVRMLTQQFENLPAAGSVGTAAALLILILLILILALR
jgi:hypothetical protein